MIVMGCNEETVPLQMVNYLLQVFRQFGKVGIAANSINSQSIAIRSMQLLCEEISQEDRHKIEFYVLDEDINVLGESKLAGLEAVPITDIDKAMNRFNQTHNGFHYICLVAKKCLDYQI